MPMSSEQTGQIPVQGYSEEMRYPFALDSVPALTGGCGKSGVALGPHDPGAVVIFWCLE